jgi:hypothetical protein
MKSKSPISFSGRKYAKARSGLWLEKVSGNCKNSSEKWTQNYFGSQAF